MKRSIYILFSLIFWGATTVLAQNEVDAIRYSQSLFGGTARAVSMGGAFGALGGDFSSLSYNPAGIGVYRGTEFTFSPTLFYDKTSADYLNSLKEDFKYNFNFNNIGFVATFGTGDDKGWVSTNFAVGYNKLNNFNNNIRIEGVSTNNSMLDYFANMADGYSYDNLYPYEDALAWDQYLIDTVIGNGYDYETILSIYGDEPQSTYGQTQRRTINTSGSMGEFVFSFGANYSHKLYLGATFGINKLRFSQLSSHREFGFAEDPVYNDTLDLEYFEFKQDLLTLGKGYSFKFGIIYKPIDMIRIGGAFHLPTFYDLHDEYFTSMDAGFVAGGNPPTAYSDYFDYNYSLTTPFKAIGSIAIKLQRIALLSFDYEFVDYSTTRLREGEDGDDFAYENDNLQDYYKATANLRAGAEIRLGPTSIRGGYALYGSPYQTSEINRNASYTAISGGIGFKEQNVSIDIAFVRTIHEETYFLYNHELHNGAKLNSTNNKVLATLGFRF